MNKTILYITGALVLGLFLGLFVMNSRTQQLGINTDGSGNNLSGQYQNGQPNRGNCLADDCLLVDGLEYPVQNLPDSAQKALDEAIADEYKALSTYEAVIAKFGTVRPFSMIKGAEEQHIASLKAIYDKYGLKVPENNWRGKITAPLSLQAACQTGVEAEIANANLYKEKLLPMVKNYEDITYVFNNLMNASLEKHLSAFEKCN